MMNTHTFIRIVFVLSILAYANTLSAKKKQPNILIILSDDQGWGDVGFNGCTDIPTPNLDALASDGIICTQGYASHSYCSPSRAGLLSGRYQQRFGHECNLPYTTAQPDDGFPLDELMLSELLVKNDFQTCAIGKWHLGDSVAYWPNNRGFQDWYGFWGGGLSYWGEPGKGRGDLGGVLRDGVPVPRDEITYLTDNFSEEAVNYIDKYSKSEKPFFMYLAYNAPHSPIHATKQYTDMVTHIEDGYRAAYASLVVGMDVGVGKVIDKLKATGEYENTLIFYYSDNGAAQNGASSHPYRGHKGMLFDGGIRVPFSVTWPNKFKSGKKYDKVVSALDIFPTILAATGVECPKNKGLDGTNLLPYLSGKKKGEPHDAVCWRYSNGAGYAIRKGKYKMVMSGYKEKFYLFDMNNDPYEHNNLAEQMPEKLAELKADYAKWNAKNIDGLWTDPHAANISKEVEKRQKYINAATHGERKK